MALSLMRFYSWYLCTRYNYKVKDIRWFRYLFYCARVYYYYGTRYKAKFIRAILIIAKKSCLEEKLYNDI